MVKWLNHVVIAAPRNGTTSHAVDPSSATGVISGTPFTPTAGRLLVCFVGGSVTSTTPSGWTLPTGGNAVANSGLYVWYRTAAGSDTFTTTHNGTNYGVVFDIYEFASGSAFVGVAAGINVSASGGAGPSLSGLTSTSNWRAAVVNQARTSATAGTVTWSVGTEETDTCLVQGGAPSTDGYLYSLTYLEDQTGAIFSSAATLTTTSPTVERLVFAVNAASSGVGGAIDPAVITLAGVTPDLSGSGTATAAVDPASLTLQGITPGLSGSGSATASVDSATVSLQGVTPALAGSGSTTAAIDSAVLNIVGVTPTLTAGGATAQIDPAVINLQGVTPTLAGTGSASRAVDPAVLGLSGQTPVLAGSGAASRSVDPAVLSLTGQTPALSGSGSALTSIDPAVVTLVGVTPTLTTGSPVGALPIYKGEEQIQAVHIGDVEVLHRYKGEVQLW